MLSNPHIRRAYVLEIDKIAAAPSLHMMEEVLKRIPPSRLAGMFPQLPFGGGWRRKTLADIATSEGHPAAVRAYRAALRNVQSGSDLPLSLRLQAHKFVKETGKLPPIGGLPRRPRMRRDASVEPIGGEGTVKLISYGPRQGLEAAIKDPASKLEPFYIPGRQRPAKEGLYFWEGDTSPVFTQSPRSLGNPGTPARLTLEIPRAKVYSTGKHQEINPLGERVVSGEDIRRYARNFKVENLSEIEKLSASRGMKELLQRLGVPKLETYVFRGRPRVSLLDQTPAARAALQADPAAWRLWGTEVEKRLSKEIAGHGGREKWDTLLEESLFRKAMTGRHGPREGEALLPASRSAETVARIDTPRTPFLYRSGPVGKGKAMYVTRHPDVAANYALDRSGGVWNDAADGTIVAIRKKGLSRRGEKGADWGPRTEGHPVGVDSDRGAMLKKWIPGGQRTGYESLGQGVRTYEDSVIPRGHDAVAGRYRVRPSRMPDGTPVLAVSRVSGISPEEAFKGLLL